MESRILVVGNWKSNPETEKEAVALLKSIVKELPKQKTVEVVIAPPASFISTVKKSAPKVALAAQDAGAHTGGAYTGEHSAKQLASVGASYVIVGHSETRARGVSNQETHEKVIQSLKAGLRPILCVGEIDRAADHAYLRFVAAQIEEGLANVPKAKLSHIAIAYEPVWAIGKDATRTATPQESLEMSIFIRRTLVDMFDKKSAESVRVIYGGSVDEKNGLSFIKEGGVTGLLPGRLSLSPKKFAALIRSLATTL